MRTIDLAAVRRDVVVAIRRLRRAPVFTTASVAMLALGLGVGTACFNIFNGVERTRRGTDFPGAVRIAASDWGAECGCVFRTDDLIEIETHPPASLAWMIGDSQHRRTAARIGNAPLLVAAEAIWGPYFDVLGARAVAGRLLSPDDDRSDTPAVVVSERLWRTRLGASPSTVGSTAYIGGQPVVVAGIVSQAFAGLTVTPIDVWVPSRVLPVGQLFGRLATGVSLERANGEMRARYALATDWGPLRHLEVRAGLWPPLGASEYTLVVSILILGTLMLGVAAVSLALLLLARVMSRQADTGLRLMLGASPWQVARLWAMEVAVIAATAAVVGLGLAAWIAQTAVNGVASFSSISMAVSTAPDWRVALYVVGLTVAVGTGLVGALTGYLGHGGHLVVDAAAAGTGGATARTAPVRRRLTLTQIAVATFLLLVSAFIVRGAARAVSLDPLAAASHAVVATLDQAGRDPARVAGNNRLALDAALHTRGVSQAGLTTGLPYGTSYHAFSAPSPSARWVTAVGVTAGYFESVALPVRDGRLFTDAEDRAAAPTAVVSEEAAAAFWPHGSPVGRPLWLTVDDRTRLMLTVVGVVHDLRREDRFRTSVYVPYQYFVQRVRHPSTVLLVATGPGSAGDLGHRLVDGVGRLAPQAGVVTVQPLDDALTGGRDAPRLIARSLEALGVFCLLIAVVGLYGLTAFLATRRRREFGVRKALGASPWRLARMVAVEGAPAFLKGLGAGAVPAVLVGYWLRVRQFPGLEPFQAATWLVVGGVLLLAGLIGTVLPFWDLITRDASAMLREE